MRVPLRLAVSFCLLAVAAPADQFTLQEIGRIVHPVRAPAGRDLATLVTRQLLLAEDQARRAEQLIAEVYADAPPIDDARLAQATAAYYETLGLDDLVGRTETRSALRELVQSERLDQYLERLRPELTSAQQDRLEVALARLERHPAGGVRPLDLLRHFRTMVPLPVSEKFNRAYRRRMGHLVRFTPEQELLMMQYTLRRIEKVLTPEQIQEMRREFAALRPDLVSEGAFVPVPPLPTSQPSGGDDEDLDELDDE